MNKDEYKANQSNQRRNKRKIKKIVLWSALITISVAIISIPFWYILSFVPTQSSFSEEIREQTRMSGPTPTLSFKVNTAEPTVNVLGRWEDTGGLNREITMSKQGDIYTMKEVYSDGSGQTITLQTKVVGGETRLYDTANAYGDYMVVESDGDLSFYDNQGLVYTIPRYSHSSSSSSSSSGSSSSSSSCDAWWDSLETAYTLSGGQDTDVTDYIMEQMMLEGCSPR